MPVLLGLDIGTTSTIGILVDVDGRTLALAQRPVTLFSDHPGWAEEDPEQWWANAGAVCRELAAGHTVDAVGVTGMLPATVLLDGGGRPVRRSIQQSDGRVAAEVEELRREVDEAAFLARTGNGINQQLVATKLRWLRRHEPESLERARHLLGAYDFVVHRLTGAWSIERNWALESGFYDLGAGDVVDDLLALGGIGRELLPAVRDGQAVVGGVTAAAAIHTGLAEGTPVVAGCADHIASAFTAGVVAPGDCLLKFGGAGDFLLATPQPRPDPRLFLDFHLVPGLFMPNGCMAASGAVLNWLVDNLGGGRSHAELDRLAQASPPGARGLLALPYFLGEKTPIHDPLARGVLSGLGLHHGVGDIWRSLLEAIAMGFRHHIEVAREIGYPVTRVLASDGGARSPIWMQIVADVIGMPVHLLTGHPGSCLGAAFVAGIGVGAFIDWGQIGRFVAPATTVRPRSEHAPAYDQLYARYRATYEQLRPLQAAAH
ncbi:MAG TPA: FGGY-family carbohydrate kinase [Geminicoccaceae bacterium]|nr:FGGY-family carbohydrate kinase [Geminicoccus sp.]HMU52098.1 FGGY-family carbohydrate kinase [Geminicoccaceae bacterium]